MIIQTKYILTNFIRDLMLLFDLIILLCVLLVRSASTLRSLTQMTLNKERWRRPVILKTASGKQGGIENSANQTQK